MQGKNKVFFSYVIPSVLAFALSGVYTIVDGFFIGQSLGDMGLAAIILSLPWWGPSAPELACPVPFAIQS